MKMNLCRLCGAALVPILAVPPAAIGADRHLPVEVSGYEAHICTADWPRLMSTEHRGTHETGHVHVHLPHPPEQEHRPPPPEPERVYSTTSTPSRLTVTTFGRQPIKRIATWPDTTSEQ